MTLVAGTKLGRYEIRSKLGEGGMGEVYSARDERLSRDVAIKVLPAALSQDAERLQRFEQEAQAAGALNHPNILAVFDVGTNEGAPYIVAELMQGEELRDQLNGKGLPQRQAIDYAQQIAQGLAAAHEKGITHRDLKPENLFVTSDGRVKILDFGLAKLRPQRSNVVSSEIATVKQITDPGTVMGTVGYMSPEQVRGATIDHRSDIFSFGSILYEMLTGQRAFQRETVAETMTAILKEDPHDFTNSDSKISLPMEKILRRCLQKKPEQRFQSAQDLAFALDALSTLSGSRSELPATTVTTNLRSGALKSARLPWILAAALLVGLLAILPFAIAHFRQATRASSPIVRYEVSTSDKSTLALVRWPAIALSPDGSTLAFVAARDGVNRLYIRKREDTEAKSLEGTEGAAEPVFSPSGRWIAFLADFTLKKVQIDGPVIVIAKVGDSRGFSWTSDDALIYAPDATTGLFKISGGGGDSQEISKLDAAKKERTHRWPQVLPDGKAVLFTVGTLDSPDSYENSNIEAVSLSTGERHILLQGASMARYVPTGHLIFARGASLYAVRFDLDKLSAHGAAESIVQGIAGDATTGAAQFAVSDDGTLAYVPGDLSANQRRLFWVDRTGKVQPIDLPPAQSQYNDVSLSPDGSRVALITGSSGSGDVWVYDFGRATSTRLTFNGLNATPVWSSDGKTIFYSQIDAANNNRTTVMRKLADGSREAEAVTSLENSVYLKAITPDGAAIVDYKIQTARADIGRVMLTTGSQVSDIVNTPFNDYAAALSPDGRWLAYQSNESGHPEIYVRDLSGTGGRWQVSTEGGEEPHWSKDNRELYFRNGGSFMSVAVQVQPTFNWEKPKELFKGIYDLRSNSGVSYDVDPKGSGRFLMIRLAETSNPPTQVRIVLNWFDQLRRAVPVP